MIRILAALALLAWAAPSVASWPDIPFPADAKIESLGNDVRLNGIPMRMHRLLSKAKSEQIAQFYRAALGSGYFERDLLGDRLFAKGLGDYFLTVRVKQLGANLTETLVSVSDARAARGAASRPLGIELPASTQVLSDMESIDAGKASRQLVLSNKHSIEANVEFFVDVLRAGGYKQEQSGGHKNVSSQSLLFKGAQREARLIVSRNESGSSVVLTTLQTP